MTITEDLIRDLYDVGTIKSLGYLPLRTVKKYCDKSIDDVIRYAKSNNIKYLILKSGECDIGSGAIYFYDEKWLSELLIKNKEILKEANVPFDNVIEYIKFISNYTVYREKYPEAYTVIGKTFNDERFR